MIARHLAPGDSETTESDLDLAWPASVYSLAHVALPFPPDVPVYGGPDAKPSPGVHLGNLALRGERGVLQITGNDLLRMHWNPFYAYMEKRTSSSCSDPQRRDYLKHTDHGLELMRIRCENLVRDCTWHVYLHLLPG